MGWSRQAQAATSVNCSSIRCRATPLSRAAPVLPSTARDVQLLYRQVPRTVKQPPATEMYRQVVGMSCGALARVDAAGESSKVQGQTNGVGTIDDWTMCEEE